MSGLKVSHKTLSLSEKFDLISKFEKGVKRVLWNKNMALVSLQCIESSKIKRISKPSFWKEKAVLLPRENEHVSTLCWKIVSSNG